MDKVERIKMVKAMEYIARQINDEEVLENWFVNGVAEGDDDMEYYIEDVDFADLMHTFLRIMSKARKSGGLYCDGILDKAEVV